MRRDPASYLWDVSRAIDSIVSFVDGVSFEDYAASPLIHSAVERKFEVIGEALNLLSKSDPELAKRIPEISRIIAFRNLLIHGYAVVDHARVWDIVRDYVPRLREEIAAILMELQAP
jgi:uncharacterized protein with HEPN domain